MAVHCFEDDMTLKAQATHGLRGVEIESTDPGAMTPVVQSLSVTLTIWANLRSCLTALCLSFLIYKERLIMVSPS